MAQSIVSEIGDMPEELRQGVIRELREGIRRDNVEAVINQKRIAVANHQQKTFRSIDGVGRIRMRIDPTLYNTCGQRYGYDCWRDKGFLKDVEKFNPEVKLRCGGTRLQFGYTPTEKKFSKSYNL